MCECKLFYFGVFVLCNVIFVTPFNIEKSNCAVYARNDSSMFGFTVALHTESGRQWVLVGAPNAQARYQHPAEVERGGAVYKCDPWRDDYCEEIRFTPSYNKRRGSNIIDNQSYQWFGATLTASGRRNGPVVACAPRYVWHTKDVNRKDPVGTCFVANGALDSYEEYSPCRTMNWGYHRQGSCQAGFSAAINKAGDRLYVGAPGSYYWQGQMYSIDAHASFSYTPSYYGYLGFGAKGTVYQQPIEDRPAVFSTREGAPPDDDSYIGYSLVVGQFREYDPNEGIAVGMPRGNKLRGKVLLFTWDLKNYKNITTLGNQIGSYFGYSITAADVNGDKRLDIIVGAPMHTERNNEMKYDVGRVYVFYQTSDESTSFNTFHFIDGKNSKGRFGHSVATLGDLNQDGYDDFAVGAPYDGPNGRGAVYIFYGSKKGIRKKYGQVIYAEDIEQRYPIQTFGFSIAGGVDIDGNEYPDMTVGSYLSDAVFFFRARPTVVVDAYVSFLTHRKQIDITKINCSLDNGKEGICTAINFCIKYTGKGIPQEMYMTLQYILDSEKPNRPRMFFKGRGTNRFNRTVKLVKHQEVCERKEVYITVDMRDKLTPLEAEVNYFLTDDPSPDVIRNPRSQLRPVLDLNSPPSKKDSIVIQKDCGEDNVCIPDLHVNVTSVGKKHYLGSGVDLEFDIVVSNFGEDSFETRFEMRYPEGIQFIKSDPGEDKSAILCDSPFNNTITCDIGNPLPARKIAKFRLLFQPPTVPAEGKVAPSYSFDAYVNSTNPEDEITRADNHKHISVEIWVDASLQLRGNSQPPTIYYNESHFTSKDISTESDIGPQVVHVYYLGNGGPSVIEEAEVYILWPSKTLGDEYLLYLLEPPQTKGNVKCYSPQEFDGVQLEYNYNNYPLESKGASIWDRLKIDLTYVEVKKEQSTEVGTGIVSGEGVVSSNTNETRYETTGSHGTSQFNRTVTTNTTITKGSMYVDEHGNVVSSFEQKTFGGSGSPGQTNQVTGETRRYYNQYGSNRTVGGQNRPHYEEHVYEVGGGAREGGVQIQGGQRQFSTGGQTFGQSGNQQGAVESRQETYYSQGGSTGGIQRQGGQSQFATAGQTFGQGVNQQGTGETRQQTYYEQRGSAGGAQFGQDINQQGAGGRTYYEQRGGTQGFGQRQYSTHNQTFGQGSGQQGGGVSYYEETIYPEEGGVIQRKTQIIESSTSIPIDIPQLQSNNQSLNDLVSGQGYRVQLIDMDNTASEISIAGANRGIPDQRLGAVGQTDGYYAQGGGSHSGSAGGHRETYGHSGGSGGSGGSSQWHMEGSYSRSGQIEPTFVHNTIERDNVPTDRPNPNQRHRGRRMTDDFLEEIQTLEKCGSTKCSYIKCTVGAVNKGKEVAILLRSRLNVRAIANITSSQSIKLSSMMVGKITKLPYIGMPRERILKKYEIFTEVPAKETELVPEVAPLWLYVVSAVAGVVMLLLLIWILSKCGFFKRNRPSSAPERQPLNRNGYQSGDEAL